MVFMLAAGMAILGGIAANEENKNKNANVTAQADAYGVKTAGIDFGAARSGEFLQSKITGIEQARTEHNVAIEKNLARAQSDATVMAAMAGVDGQSVDAVANDTERSAAEATRSVNDQARQQKLQTKTDYVDNFLNAHISKGNAKFNAPSKETQATNTALGFAKGFIGGF